MREINLYVTIVPESEYISETLMRKKVIELANIQNDILLLSEKLPDKISFYEKCAFGRNKMRLIFFIDTPLFYQKDIIVELYFNRRNAQEKPRLTLSIFSDELTRIAFINFARENPTKANCTETSYSFDAKGNYTKTIELHEDFAIGRKPFSEFGSTNEYSSKMSGVDFVYAERALQVLKAGLEDYIKFGIHTN